MLTPRVVLAGAREAGDEESLRPAHDPRLHRVHASSPNTGRPLVDISRSTNKIMSLIGPFRLNYLNK